MRSKTTNAVFIEPPPFPVDNAGEPTQPTGNESKKEVYPLWFASDRGEKTPASPLMIHESRSCTSVCNFAVSGVEEVQERVGQDGAMRTGKPRPRMVDVVGLSRPGWYPI